MEGSWLCPLLLKLSLLCLDHFLNIVDTNFLTGLVSDDDHSSPRDQECHEISLPVKNSSPANADSAKSAANTDDAVEADFANYILKCKSVYKCKLCPRIMCLNEDMVRVHLKSKVMNIEEC